MNTTRPRPKLRRRLLASLGLSLALGLHAPLQAASLLDKEIHFTEAEVQAELDKRGPLEKRYGDLLTASLPQAPTIRLGQPEGRATVLARVHLSLGGAPAVPVDLKGTAGLRYDETGKAFYLDQPEAESVDAPALAPEYRGIIRQALSQLMRSYFRKQPLYRLREDASPQEATARWLLRSVRIERGRVVAVLSPL